MVESYCLDTESAKIIAKPFICCSFMYLCMVVASKPHELHFSLSVLPVLVNQNARSKMSFLKLT